MKKLIILLLLILPVVVFGQEVEPVKFNLWDLVKGFLTWETISSIVLSGGLGSWLGIKYRASKLKDAFTELYLAVEDDKVTEAEFRSVWAKFKLVFTKEVK